MSLKSYLIVFLAFLPAFGMAQNLFQPFTSEWPTPNATRMGSGAPGAAYWQQQADYKMKVTLDTEKKRLSGSETITYFNNSPVSLSYLWLQMDQDLRDPHSVAHQMEKGYAMEATNAKAAAFNQSPNAPGGYDLTKVSDANGNELKHFIGETNLRIELPTPLAPGGQFSFQVDWAYNINDATLEGRSGYEYFEGDGNYVFEIAQFYPRMCAYSLEKGWQNRPFYGSAEFALDFGNYEVEITLPDNFLVGGTGTLKNEDEVLSKDQRKRLSALSKSPGEVSFIVTPAEAEKNKRTSSKKMQTWRFEADQVRDFAFAASKKFVWDAGVVEVGGKSIVAQSMYPTEAMPLWDKYATHVVMHTLETYSKYSVDYPYPHATAIHGPVWGMEYPMISFCGGRPQDNGYYSRDAKYRMIGVIIHEVGHNFFPMIVNSDERRWAWMDEGLNSFLEYLTEREWEPHFPHRRGPADDVAFALLVSDARAIMTNPESIRDNGLISYAKTAAGLNLLRTIVLGPENFDYAFKTYAQRWAFKHPEPADFFRSMEDASGQDLDWFWRGWFYGTGVVDFGIKGVRHYSIPVEGEQALPDNPYPVYQVEKLETFYISNRPNLNDEYTSVKEAWNASMSQNEKAIAKLVENHKQKSASTVHFYQVEIIQKEDVVMPIVMQAIFADGSRLNYKLPAQLWIEGEKTHVHNFRSDKEVVAFQLDGLRLLPESDRSDNICPRPSLGIEFTEIDLSK